MSNLRSVGFSFFVNLIIFSFLPLLHYLFHKSPSEIKPIEVEIIKLKRDTKQERKQKPHEIKKITKLGPKTILKPKPELRQRITLEITPDTFADEFADEVDLTVPMVTYDLSEVDQPPKLIKYIEPEYPEEAIIKGVEGVVVLKILINHEGKVVMVKVLDNDGIYEFGQAASRAVKRWYFEPAKIMGTPVDVWCIQKIRFELKKRNFGFLKVSSRPTSC